MSTWNFTKIFTDSIHSSPGPFHQHFPLLCMEITCLTYVCVCLCVCMIKCNDLLIRVHLFFCWCALILECFLTTPFPYGFVPVFCVMSLIISVIFQMLIRQKTDRMAKGIKILSLPATCLLLVFLMSSSVVSVKVDDLLCSRMKSMANHHMLYKLSLAFFDRQLAFWVVFKPFSSPITLTFVIHLSNLEMFWCCFFVSFVVPFFIVRVGLLVTWFHSLLV